MIKDRTQSYYLQGDRDQPLYLFYFQLFVEPWLLSSLELWEMVETSCRTGSRTIYLGPLVSPSSGSSSCTSWPSSSSWRPGSFRGRRPPGSPSSLWRRESKFKLYFGIIIFRVGQGIIYDEQNKHIFQNSNLLMKSRMKCIYYQHSIEKLLIFRSILINNLYISNRDTVLCFYRYYIYSQ